MHREVLSQEGGDEEDSHTEPESDDETEVQKNLRSQRNPSRKSQKSVKARSPRKPGSLLPSPSRLPLPISTPATSAALGKAVNQTVVQSQLSAGDGISPNVESSADSWDAQSFPSFAFDTQALERLPSAAADFLGMFKKS